MPHSLGKLQRIRGNLLDVFTGDIYSAQIEFQDGIITCVQPLKAKFDHYILPGFIDAHIHIEVLCSAHPALQRQLCHMVHLQWWLILMK